jgi:hypothetical protein
MNAIPFSALRVGEIFSLQKSMIVPCVKVSNRLCGARSVGFDGQPIGFDQFNTVVLGNGVTTMVTNSTEVFLLDAELFFTRGSSSHISISR